MKVWILSRTKPCVLSIHPSSIFSFFFAETTYIGYGEKFLLLLLCIGSIGSSSFDSMPWFCARSIDSNYGWSEQSQQRKSRSTSCRFAQTNWIPHPNSASRVAYWKGHHQWIFNRTDWCKWFEDYAAKYWNSTVATIEYGKLWHYQVWLWDKGVLFNSINDCIKCLLNDDFIFYVWP